MMPDNLQGREGRWDHFMVEKSPSELRQQDVMWTSGAGLCDRGEDRGGSGEGQGDWSIHSLKLTAYFLHVSEVAPVCSHCPSILTPLSLSSFSVSLFIS